MFNQYPYLNLNDLNLDYILKAIKEMRYEVTNFVSINAIKYADPIQWNITSQYEKNTIVIDPVTGTAYISVAPVPAGVALTRTEYWTLVFDLGAFVTRAAQNFTDRWESDTTLTATFATPAGAWLVWGDVLYKALTNITAGDTYVIGSNIEHFTIEQLIDAINTTLNVLHIDDENIRGSIATNELANTNASMHHDNGVLVWWNDNLYETTAEIQIGDVLAVGTNLTNRTVNDYIIGKCSDLYNVLHDALHRDDENIRGSIAANELDNVNATMHHDNGVLVWWNDNLYETTAEIQIGDPFVVGTNLVLRNVNDYILARISALVLQINALLAVTNAGATPKYLTVGSSGCNFTTINAAVTFAKTYCTLSNRVTIIVMGGDYNESISLIDNPGIDLYGINHPTIRSNINYPDGAINFSGSMRIHGFTLLNIKSDSNSYAIHYEAQQSPARVSNNIHISDCDIASWGNAGIGAGLASGDVFEVENCRISSFYPTAPALLTHPFPFDTAEQSSEYYRECTFKSLSDYAIIIHNSRAMQGNAGTSNMLFRCIGCLANDGHNKIKYQYDANNSQAYIPKTGEIHLESDSLGNNMIGVNYESAGDILHQYRLAMPSLYNWTDGVDYRRYSNGIEFKNRALYTLTLQQCISMDNTDLTGRSNIDANLPDNIGVNIMDDVNDTYKDNIQAGIIVRIVATPAL